MKIDIKKLLKVVQDRRLHLRVHSKEGILFDGNAMAISSYNNEGPFDVLPEHAHFISIVLKEATIYKNENDKEHLIFGKGVLKIKDNMGDIFIGLGK
jgi:F0F1-type ATP synthase epsilon subunit